MGNDFKLELVKIERPNDGVGVNMILGMSHFIKTVEDVHEALVNAVPDIKFGVAFCEASMDKRIRFSSTDKEMETLALTNAKKIKAGHSFVIFLKDVFPINVLRAIKQVPEVCSIYCATANPVDVLVVENTRGRGIVGVIDGSNSGIPETESEKKERYDFLRKIGYKM